MMIPFVKALLLAGGLALSLIAAAPAIAHPVAARDHPFAASGRDAEAAHRHLRRDARRHARAHARAELAAHYRGVYVATPGAYWLAYPGVGYPTAYGFGHPYHGRRYRDRHDPHCGGY